MRSRLIQQQHFGLLRQSAGQQHPLPLAAGQSRHGTPGEFRQASGVQRLGDNLLIALGFSGKRAARQVRRAAHANHFADGEVQRNRCFLRHHGHFLRGVPRFQRHIEIAAVQQHDAPRRAQGAGQRMKQCGLAGAIRADNAAEHAGAEGSAKNRAARSVLRAGRTNPAIAPASQLAGRNGSQRIVAEERRFLKRDFFIAVENRQEKGATVSN